MELARKQQRKLQVPVRLCIGAKQRNSKAGILAIGRRYQADEGYGQNSRSLQRCRGKSVERLWTRGAKTDPMQVRILPRPTKTLNQRG